MHTCSSASCRTGLQFCKRGWESERERVNEYLHINSWCNKEPFAMHAGLYNGRTSTTRNKPVFTVCNLRASCAQQRQPSGAPPGGVTECPRSGCQHVRMPPDPTSNGRPEEQ